MEARIWWVKRQITTGESMSDLIGTSTVETMMMACRGGTEPSTLEFFTTKAAAIEALHGKLTLAAERFTEMADRIECPDRD